MTAVLNLGHSPIELKAGDRISQLVIVKVYTPEVIMVDELDVTDRGDGGFGSTN